MSSGLLAYLTTHLPNFTHHIVKVSAARAVYEMEHGASLCTTDILVTPERAKIVVFAARRMELPGFRLLIRKDKMGALAPAITGRGQVNLAKMLEIPGLTGAYTNSRHYGPAISDYIQRHGPDGLDTEVATFHIVNLLKKGRIDYGFALPMDLYFYFPEDQSRDVVLLPVLGETPFITAAIACSSDPVGRAALHDIDALLADDARWSEYVESLRKWIGPEDFESLRTGRSNMDRVP